MRREIDGAEGDRVEFEIRIAGTDDDGKRAGGADPVRQLQSVVGAELQLRDEDFGSLGQHPTGRLVVRGQPDLTPGLPQPRQETGDYRQCRRNEKDAGIRLHEHLRLKPAMRKKHAMTKLRVGAEFGWEGWGKATYEPDKCLHNVRIE